MSGEIIHICHCSFFFAGIYFRSCFWMGAMSMKSHSALFFFHESTHYPHDSKSFTCMPSWGLNTKSKDIYIFFPLNSTSSIRNVTGTKQIDKSQTRNRSSYQACSSWLLNQPSSTCWQAFFFFLATDIPVRSLNESRYKPKSYLR